MVEVGEATLKETRTYSINFLSLLEGILEREGWREAPKGSQPDFSMLAVPFPLPGKAPPMTPEVREAARQYRLKHPLPPPPPPAPIRMHAAPGILALNDKVSFFLQLQAHGLLHLHPQTVLLEDLEDLLSHGGFAKDCNDAPLCFLKHRYGGRGATVFCFKSLEALDEYVKKWKMLSLFPDKFIVQAGIRPLLLNGRKPLLRIFVLIISRRIYVHREFMIKVLKEEYSEATDDHHAHVDCCVLQPGVSLIRGSDWSEYPSFFPKVCHAAQQIMSTYINLLEPEPDEDGLRYVVIGLDVIATADGQPKVLEANTPPSLSEGSDEPDVAKAIKLEVQEDLYRFLIVGLGRTEAEHGGFIEVDR